MFLDGEVDEFVGVLGGVTRGVVSKNVTGGS